MGQGASSPPRQRTQPLRSHPPALQWPSQGSSSGPPKAADLRPNPLTGTLLPRDHRGRRARCDLCLPSHPTGALPTRSCTPPCTPPATPLHPGCTPPAPCCTPAAGACLPSLQDGQELRWLAAHGERVACLEAGAWANAPSAPSPPSRASIGPRRTRRTRRTHRAPSAPSAPSVLAPRPLAPLCPQVFGILSFLVGIMMIVFSSGVFYLEVESTKDCIAEAEVPRR